MKKVIVAWLDSTGSGGWKSHEETTEWIEKQSMMMVSVGFLLHKDDKCIVLASTVYHAGRGYGDLVKIPLSAVVSMRLLVEEK